MIHNLFRPAVVSATGKVLFLGLAVGLLSGGRASAQTPLPPGTAVSVPVPTIVTGTPPFGDTLLRELQSPVFGTNGPNTISGTVTSAAFRNGSGTLDFLYQFAFDALTNINVNTVSITSFQNVGFVAVAQTSEDVDGPGGLPAQDLGGANQNLFTLSSASGSFVNANRPNANGDSINASLSSGVNANQTTFTFVVRTDATEFSLAGSASVQGGGISAFTAAQGAIAPVGIIPAPEPTALSLLALGVVACAVPFRAVRRRVGRGSHENAAG